MTKSNDVNNEHVLSTDASLYCRNLALRITRCDRIGNKIKKKNIDTSQRFKTITMEHLNYHNNFVYSHFRLLLTSICISYSICHWLKIVFEELIFPVKHQFLVIFSHFYNKNYPKCLKTLSHLIWKYLFFVCLMFNGTSTQEGQLVPTEGVKNLR